MLGQKLAKMVPSGWTIKRDEAHIKVLVEALKNLVNDLDFLGILIINKNRAKFQSQTRHSNAMGN